MVHSEQSPIIASLGYRRDYSRDFFTYMSK